MQAGLKSASKQVDDFERRTKASLRGVESAWSKLSNSNFSQGFLSGFGIQRGQGLDALAGGAVANLISGAVQQGVEKMRDLSARGMEYYDLVQMTKMSFGTLLDDMEKGKQLTADMLKFARITPFDDGPVLKYSQALLAAKVHTQDLQTYLTGIGNALAASGTFANMGSQQATVRAITQMLGKPNLMSEELKLQLADHVPSAIADMAAALGLSRESLTQKMSEGSVKSGPAIALLIDYWNKKYSGQMEFAGVNTFAGLESSKRSAEDAMMANAFAGGDVLNPSATGAGATRLQALRDQIVRRDELGKAEGFSNALGELATAYLKARDKDDELIFALTGSAANRGAGSIVTNTAQKVSDNMAAPPGFFLGQSIGEYIGDKTGIKPLATYFPWLNNLNPDHWGTGNDKDGLSNLAGWAKSLFTGATAGAIDSVEKGKGPMNQAGASLGNSLITGMKSEKGLDSRSPSRKAIEEGLNVRRGLFLGLKDPSIDLSGAGAGLADEIFGGFGNRRRAAFAGGLSQREYLEQVGQNPTVKAFFEAIKKAEGGAPDIMAGGRRTGRLDIHPGEIVPMSQWFRGDKGPSSASGNWQITRTNWRRLAPELGLNDFSEHSQYIAALKLFSDREGGAGMRALLSGDISTAMKIAAMDWTSTPGSTIGGGKQLAKNRWMGFFNNALESGGGSVSPSSPIPVVVVSMPDMSIWDRPDFGGGAAQSIFRGPVRRQPTKRSSESRSIHDPVPVIIDVVAEAQELSTTFTAVSEQALMLKKPLALLGDAASTTAKNLGGLTEEEIAAKRAEALSGDGKAKKKKRDPLFDSAFTREGLAGDFHGGLSSLLGNMGWGGSAKDLGKQFLFNFARDAQQRIGHDISSMLTGSIFGTRGEDGKLTGGLFGGKSFNLGGIFSKLFGGLFGGFRASGGSMSPGRFYMAGENGPELITGPGYVHNNRETRQMMGGGGDPSYTIVAIGDREVGRAVDAYRLTPRGRRARMIEGKYMRKIMAYS